MKYLMCLFIVCLALIPIGLGIEVWSSSVSLVTKTGATSMSLLFTVFAGFAVRECCNQ